MPFLRSEASLALALDPDPPATARFLNLSCGYFLANIFSRACKPFASEPLAHQVNTPTSPPAPPALGVDEDVADPWLPSSLVVVELQPARTSIDAVAKAAIFFAYIPNLRVVRSDRRLPAPMPQSRSVPAGRRCPAQEVCHKNVNDVQKRVRCELLR